MKIVGKSCDTFVLPKEVVSQIGTMPAYGSEESEVVPITSNSSSSLFEED